MKALAGAPHKVGREFGDVFATVPQGGHFEGEDADIHPPRHLVAHPFELAFLQHAQQLLLEFGRNLAHFARKAQFTLTSALRDRGLRSWISRAISSSPLPLSPRMTLASVGATSR